MRSMQRSLLLLCFSSMFSLQVWAESSPQVLVSIKPLALLLAPLVSDEPEEQSLVQTLLPANASPHHYAMSVSDRRKLSEADLFVWVGVDLERFLAKPVGTMGEQKTLAASEVSGLSWPADVQGHGHAGHSEHDFHDPHLWLNPMNAKTIVMAFAERLTLLNPALAATYQTRATNLASKIDNMAAKIRKNLESHQSSPFLVSHDGFAHFVQHFELNQMGAVSAGSDAKPGARHIAQLRGQLESEKVACVFVERDEGFDWGKRLADDVGIRSVLLDPLGRSHEIKSYEDLLGHLLAGFEQCFQQERI